MSTTLEAVAPGRPDPNIDVHLQILVDVITGTENALPIILTVGGIVITGELVSGHKYVNNGGEWSEPKNEHEKAMQDYFKRMEKNYTERAADAPMPSYIHVRNAQLLVGGAKVFVRDNGGFWRGKLTAVDGFILGRGDLNQ